DLAGIPYLPDTHVAGLLEQARVSVASLGGPTAAELVRDQVRQLRDANARQKRLENLLVEAYRGLPTANHLDTIPGIGAVTPAVRALYRRVVAKHPGRKAIAIGHAMRKLLHLAFALWKSDQPFDPRHYPWQEPAPTTEDEPASGPSPEPAGGTTSQAAGHKPA